MLDGEEKGKARLVSEGDIAVLYDSSGRSAPFSVAPMAKVPSLGVVDLSGTIGGPWGAKVMAGRREFTLIPRSFRDAWEGLERGPQIILPKDAVRMLQLASVGPGSLVIEAGAGSGSLTMAACNAVRPGGRVVSYDTSDRSLRVARANVESAGLSQYWEGVFGDAKEGVRERDADAFIADVPGPAGIVGPALEALAPGGYVVAYCPVVGELEEVAREMRTKGFAEVEAMEVIERSWVVHDRGSRPDFAKLGHTGFVVSGRKVSL